MPLNRAEIEISTKLTGTGLADASEQMRELKKETVDAATFTRDSANPAAEQYSKTLKAVGKEAEKTNGFHKQLKDGIKGLATQFPELAHAAHLFINPLTLAVGGLVTAFAILKDKLSDGSVDLEKHKGFDPVYINKAADAWNNYAAAIKTVGDQTARLKADLAAITTHFGVLDKIGGKDSNPLVAKRQAEQAARAQTTAAANLRIKAQQLRQQAAGINVGTEEGDKSVDEKIKRDAEEAKQKNEELESDFTLVDRYEMDKEGSSDENIIDRAIMAAQYNAKFGLADPGKIRATLQQQKASNDQMIARAEANRRRTDTRAGQRAAKAAMLNRANELETQATSIEQERDTGLFNSQVQFGVAQFRAGNAVPVTTGGNGMSITPAAMKEVQSAYAELAALAKLFADGNAKLRAYVQAQANKSSDQRTQGAIN